MTECIQQRLKTTSILLFVMKGSPESSLMITTEDPNSITQLKPVQSPILYKFLQPQ